MLWYFKQLLSVNGSWAYYMRKCIYLKKDVIALSHSTFEPTSIRHLCELQPKDKRVLTFAKPLEISLPRNFTCFNTTAPFPLELVYIYNAHIYMRRRTLSVVSLHNFILQVLFAYFSPNKYLLGNSKLQGLDFRLFLLSTDLAIRTVAGNNLLGKRLISFFFVLLLSSVFATVAFGNVSM